MLITILLIPGCRKQTYCSTSVITMERIDTVDGKLDTIIVDRVSYKCGRKRTWWDVLLHRW